MSRAVYRLLVGLFVFAWVTCIALSVLGNEADRQWARGMVGGMLMAFALPVRRALGDPDEADDEDEPNSSTSPDDDHPAASR